MFEFFIKIFSDILIVYLFWVMTCITQHDFPITQAKMALSHRVFIT
jgi:hypothetical protein